MFGFLSPLLRRLLGESSTDLRGLLIPFYLVDLITSHRAHLIISRVRMIAALFAFLSPLWIILDLILLPNTLWAPLAVARIVATMAFAVLALLYQRSDRTAHAYAALALMFAIPTLFILYSHHLFSGTQLEGVALSLVAGYAFLPFVIATGLAVFPLTALEGVAFALPALAVQWIISLEPSPLISGDAQLGLLWLLALISAVAVLSGMSQLHYLSEIVLKSAHDPLTGAFNRRAGMELLEKYFTLAERNGTHLTLVFIDLDHFKWINDRSGHEAGDAVLRRAALAMGEAIRREDILIRWGGEEFLLVLPHSRGGRPGEVLTRLAATGIGQRPEGTPMTASMGQAEFVNDAPIDLGAFVEIADRRMYRAKEAGRNRLCWGDGEDQLSEEWITP